MSVGAARQVIGAVPPFAAVLRIVLADHELVVGAVLFEELERVLRTKLRFPAAQIEAVRRALVTPDPVG